MKRSLILLLVLAMVAMMIPGFAMADEPEFKIQANVTSIEASLTARHQANIYVSISAQTAGNWDCWATLPSDQKIVKFNTYNPYYYSLGDSIDSDSPANLYSLYVLAEGSTNLTIHANNSYSGDSATLDIPVVVKKAAAIESVAFDKNNIPVGNLELTVGDSGSNFVNNIIIKPDDKPTYYDAYNGILWSVSDPKVAKVQANGTVIPVAEGSVTLTATAIDNANAKDTLDLKVKAAKEEEKPVEKAPTLVFSTSEFTVNKSSSINLYDYLKVIDPADGDYYIWTSSNEDIVSVDYPGKYDDYDYDDDYAYAYARGLKVGGPVTITVRSKKFPLSTASCTVTVEKAKIQLEEISFSNVPETIELGDTLSLESYLNTKPVNYSDVWSDIEWETTNPQVAYVEDRRLQTRGIGDATITAVYKDNEAVKGEFKIKVVPVPITKINFAKSEYTLVVKSSYEFSSDHDYSFEPSNYTKGEYFTVKFTSDNDDVVRIDWGNNIYTENVGEANITMTVRNSDGSVVVSDPIKVTVTDKALTAIGFKKDAYTFKLSNRKESKDMALKLTPADAFVEDGDLYVESSDPSVATATVDGTDVSVHAYKGGKTTLTVKSHTKADLTGKTEFTVDPIKLESVSLEEQISAPYFTDAKGSITFSEKQIKATINPSDAFYKATWETSDPSVLLVSGDEDSLDATILPVGAGTAKVTVTVTDGTNTFKATSTVTVKAAKVTKLALSTTKATVYRIKGEENTLQLTATDTKTDAVVPVTWASSNKKIATVSKTGLVTFKKAGKVNITATTKDGNKTKATCKLTIKQLKVTKVVPAKKTMTMKVGDKATLVVNLKPAKAFNKTLAFKSSNKKVVTVDADGNVTAVKAGKAVITITAKDGSKKSAKVTITVKGVASNAIDEIGDVAVDAENDIELTLDSIDGIDNIDDLFIDGDVVLDANDAGVVEID